MAVTSKRSLFYFHFAAKVRNVPYEVARYVSGYLVGTNAYLHHTLQQVVFFKQEDDMDPKAWRQHVNKASMLLSTDRVYETMVGMVAPLKYALFSDGVRQPLFYYTDELQNVQEIKVHEAVCVERLPPEAVHAMYSVMQDSALYTAESFQLHFGDPTVLRYAALVAGFTDRDLLFFYAVPPHLVKPYCLKHLVLLGKLLKNDVRSCLPLWAHQDEGLLRDLVQFFVCTKNVKLLHTLEQWISFHEFDVVFSTYMVVSMVLFDGYNKPLNPWNIKDEKFLFIVLNELLRTGVPHPYLMKYACMLNLNVQSEAFRAVFHETIQTAQKKQHKEQNVQKIQDDV